MDWNETMPWSKNIQKHVLTYFKYIFQQIPAQGCFNVPMLEATSISGHQILWPRAKPVWIVWIAMVAPMCRWFNMLYRFYPLNMRLSIATLNNVMVYYIYIHVSKYIYTKLNVQYMSSIKKWIALMMIFQAPWGNWSSDEWFMVSGSKNGIILPSMDGRICNGITQMSNYWRSQIALKYFNLQHPC